MPTIVSSYIPTLAGSADARTADSLPFPFTALPQAMSIYVKFQERGTIYLPNGTRIVHIGTNGATGARIGITRDTSQFYVGTYNNGINASSVSSGNSSIVPTVGQMVELLLTLSSSGVITLSWSFAGAAVSSAAGSTARRLPPAWAGQSLYLNSFGTAGSGAGAIALTNLVIVSGVLDMTAMRRYAATQRAA